MELSSLIELGLSEGQIAVFEAVLELGRSSLNAIHEKTGIERRNIYDILNKLIERGLIAYTIENKKRTYQCVHPNILSEEIQKKEEALESLKGKLPEIKNLFLSSKQGIGAEVYRGNEAIKSLLNESLDYKQQYWIGGNSGIESTNLKIWYMHWNENRRKKRIMLYDLVDFGSYMQGLEPGKIKEHKRMLYKYCQLPKDLCSPMVILIFGNKVAQILWSKQSFAVVIESVEIKESFMRYFHYFWKEPW